MKTKHIEPRIDKELSEEQENKHMGSIAKSVN